MSVRIGINPLTWSNDDLPSLGGETPLETCLREGLEAGYVGFELGNKFPRDPDVLGPILQKHGLLLASGWCTGGVLAHGLATEKEVIAPHLHLLSQLGCRALVYCDITGTVQGQQQTPLSRRPRLAADAWDSFTRQMGELAQWVLGEHGLELCYHHHMGTVIESQAEIERLMDNTPDYLKLLLDTGHCYFAGGDPVTVARAYAARIGHVHCKDMRAGIVRDVLNRDTSFIDALLAGAFAVPGDGCIDYPAVFDSLAKAGYDRWLIVEAEQDPIVAPSLEHAKRGFDYLQKTAIAAGLL